MYFRPPNESPWSPPSGAVLNPWLAPSASGVADGGTTGNNSGARGGAAAYWSDAPFPKDGSTYESLLNELVDKLYTELYGVIEREDTESPTTWIGEPAPPPAPPLEESSAASRSKVTGIFEAPQLPPHPGPNATQPTLGAVFPSPAEYRTCGKLALLYPLRASWIVRSVNRKLDENDWRSVKTCAILINWLKEMYSDELNEGEPGANTPEAPATRSCVCNYCQRSFKPYSFRVRCAECVDYDLCERCFSEGREADTHLKTHRYIPIGPQNLPLFKDQWSASEELILLEAVGKYGFGNWNEVGEWVSIVSPGNTIPKDKDACKKQYFDFHLMNRKTHSVPTWPIQNVKSRLLYDGSLGFTQALHQFCQNDPAAKGGGLLAHTDNIESIVDYSPAYDASGIDLLISRKHQSSPSVAQYTEPEWPDEFSDSSVWEQPDPTVPIYYQAAKPSGALPPRVSIVGYLPNRGESDNEWENNYELNICDLEIKEYETPMEKELKLRALEAYNTVLDQRALRKRLYLDKYILNSPSNPIAPGGQAITGSLSNLDFKTKWLSKNNTSDVREVYTALRQLWRYVYTNRAECPPALFTKSQKHHECFADVLPSDLEDIPELISDDAQLIDRLDLLTAWKEAGLSTLEEVVQKGSSMSQMIDARDPVHWSMKYYVDQKGGTKNTDISAILPEIKSEGSSNRGRAAQNTDSAAELSCIRPPLSLMERMRQNLGLSDTAFESLKISLKKKLEQVASGAGNQSVDSQPPLIDLILAVENERETTTGDAAAASAATIMEDGGKGGMSTTAHESREETSAPQQSNPPSQVGTSANAVLSFAQRQVISQHPSGSTPPVRTIPKKRRMLNVEEEGEIPGG